MNENKINIAKEFTDLPIGRFNSDSKDRSGQAFREDLLVPALKKAIDENTALTIDFDGMRGLNASFLDEAFAGVIRKKMYYRFRCRKATKDIRFCTKRNLL